MKKSGQGTLWEGQVREPCGKVRIQIKEFGGLKVACEKVRSRKPSGKARIYSKSENSFEGYG